MGNGMNIEKLREELNRSKTGQNSIGPLFGVGWASAIDYVLELIEKMEKENNVSKET